MASYGYGIKILQSTLSQGQLGQTGVQPGGVGKKIVIVAVISPRHVFETLSKVQDFRRPFT